MNIDTFIDLALQEDIGTGDYSTLACIPPHVAGTAQLRIKEPGIIAGIELAERIFSRYDAGLSITIHIPDGKPVQAGDIAFEISGEAASILSCERLILNCLQRMSGIATHTKELLRLIEGTQARLLDTRKTTPLFRFCEKWAVAIGGGNNHRFGLYDMIMLKDNHIDYAGGISKAIQDVRSYLENEKRSLPIVVEARNIDDVKEILRLGNVQRILLDNFSPEQMKQAVSLIEGKLETEASGGITKKNIRQYAETGVDFISVGALTHQVNSLDMSLKAVIKRA